MTVAAAALAVGVVCAPPTAASAQERSPWSDLSGVLDLRIGIAEADQPSWIEGDYGRVRQGQGAEATVGEATLIWRPRLSEAVSAHVNLAFQPGLDVAVDVVEAYVAYRSAPDGPMSLSARLGSFFPPISLEHDDLFWSTVDAITPSAINAWLTEEVRLNGLEVTARRRTDRGTIGLTGAVFGGGDTAGALLAFRGWALHDLKAGVFGELPLPVPPPGRAATLTAQAPFTRPNVEVDDRAGYFGKLEWRGSGHTLALSHYDNAGSRVGLRDGQYAWETRFTQVAVRAIMPLDVEVTVQAMQGRTQMGPSLPQVLYDADFSSAFLMAGRDFGPGRLTVRGETFRVRDRSFRADDDQDEDGWAAAAAWVQDVTPRLQVRTELLHVTGRRAGLTQLGRDPDQTETLFQLALRTGF